MSRSSGYRIALVVVGMMCIGYLWYTRHTTFLDVLNEAVELAPLQRDAVTSLLDEAGIAARQVRLVEALPDTPCWRVGWGSVDYFLRVHSQFGRFGENCISLDGGEVVSFSLVESRLAEARALGMLTGMRAIQLRGSRIARLDYMPESCIWEIAILQDNALTDIDALRACTALEELDVSFNALTALPDLSGINRLKKLRADNNELAFIAGLHAHPALEDVYLYNNRLTSLSGLVDMPWLETVDVSGNALASLTDLKGLPALRQVRAGSNRIEVVERAVFDRFPLLQHVSLARTALREMPEGYRLSRRNRTSVEIERLDGGVPIIEVIDTPLANALQDEPAASLEARGIIHVGSLPALVGTAQNARGQGRTGGTLVQQVNYAGTISRLEGAHSHPFRITEAIPVTVQASVHQGRLRIYLANFRGSYHYMEATPEGEIEMTGRLIAGENGYAILFEAVDGPAEGIQWSVR